MYKIVFGWIIGALLLLQAVRIDLPSPPSHIDPKNEITAPEEIMTMLRTSCYDCHSYETKMPWYGHISPVSLQVNSHIKQGRAWLNFQEWNSYDAEKRQKIYKGIADTINLRMPVPMYLTFHDEAKLTAEQRNRIKKWAQNQLKEENR